MFKKLIQKLKDERKGHDSDSVEYKELTERIEAFESSERAINEAKNEMQELQTKFTDANEKASTMETKAGEMETKAGKLQTELEEAKAEHAELVKRFDAIEEKLNGPEGLGQGPGKVERKDMGGAFVQRLMKAAGEKADVGRYIEGKNQFGFDDLEVKDFSAASVTALGTIGGERLQTIVEDPKMQLTVIGLMARQTTNKDTIYWVKVKNFYQIYGKITATATAGTKLITVDNINGWNDGSTITLEQGATTETAVIASTTPAATGDGGVITTVANLSNTYTAHSNTVDSSVYSDQFTFTALANLKPVARMETESVNSPIAKLATGIVVADEIMDDYPQLETIINEDLRHALNYNLEREVLYGSSSSSMIGIMDTASGINTLAWSAGVVGDTRWDAIHRAITLQRLSRIPANALVMNPSTFQDIRLTKLTTGEYLMPPDVLSASVPMIWGLPAIISEQIEADHVLVGNFGMGARLWIRKDMSIQVFNQHADLAQHNQKYIRGELRAGLELKYPAAFLDLTLDNTPTGGS